MAEERGQVTNTEGVDPLSDEGLGISQSGQGDNGDSVQSSPTSTDGTQELKVDFGGLPFKSMEEMVKGHKSLQDAYRQSREELWQIRQYIQSVAPLLQNLQSGTKAAPREEPVDIPRFLEEFIQQGPKAVTSLADRQFDSRMKTWQEQTLTPMQQQLNQLQTDRQIDRFMSDHPEIQTEDEDALLEVIQQTPWIRGMQGSVNDKLDAALSVLLRKEPTRFSSRGEAAKTSGAMSSMKQAATAVGAKAGTKPNLAKDEFDAVLEQDAKSRARWR